MGGIEEDFIGGFEEGGVVVCAVELGWWDMGVMSEGT